MPHTVLNALLNIENFHNLDLSSYSANYLIRINNVGAQLEFYMKDAFVNSFELNQTEKNDAYINVFSYLGAQNNPTDFILNKSDAFEVKKIESPRTNIALNNSPPKDRLHVDDPRITNYCRECEEEPWQEKDIFYVVGYVSRNRGINVTILRRLLIIHGLCYCASRDHYHRVHEEFREVIREFADENNYEMGESRELGRLRRIDPLGITTYRMRGMWEIQNPFVVYDNLCPDDHESDFSAILILTDEKYSSYPIKDRNLIEKNQSFLIKNVQIRNPNNPANTINSKIITCIW